MTWPEAFVEATRTIAWTFAFAWIVGKILEHVEFN